MKRRLIKKPKRFNWVMGVCANVRDPYLCTNYIMPRVRRTWLALIPRAVRSIYRAYAYYMMYGA